MKIHNIILCLVALFSLGGCFTLEEETFSELSSDAMFSTKASANTVLWGCYDGLQDYYPPTSIGYGSTDEIIPESWFTGTPMMDYNIVASSKEVYTFWKNTYEGINRCNSFLENMVAPEWADEDTEIWIAEAKAIRAYHYLNLVRLFGEVPLLLNSTKSIQSAKPDKQSMTDVYAQIIIDLNEAKAILPLASEVSQQPRLSKGSIQGLLMTTYASMAGYPLNQKNKWNDVITVFEEMEAEEQHALNPSYASIFENMRDDVYDTEYREILMEVAFSTGITEGGPVSATRIGDAGDVYDGGSYATNIVPVTFINSYDPYDFRRDWNISTTKDAKKYVRRKNTTYHPFDNPINWIVMRYADAMLLYAEALNEVNNGPTDKAIELVNQIRHRARPEEEKDNNNILPDLQLSDYDYELFRDHIMQERSWELCFEGQRWFDLKRWNLLVHTVKAIANGTDSNEKNAKASINISDKNVRYPIPQREIDLNPNLLPQNSGY
ncbi:RagB/SusD family nutrient uptake outer membrane protein [Puteibacter caeruleilacunae]|nr:RagB/SusD family nutrient uptake outer membrane protein [Puteibacter caeruleilacunae]